MLKKLSQSLFKSFTILLFSFFLINANSVVAADLNFSNLVPCKDSQAFNKRLATSTKKLENRLKFYEKNSNEYENIIKKIESTTARFEKYKDNNLLCGKEGLPRIIATGQWDHANEFIVPGILFLYITGWIGWVGRKYLNWALSTENSFENEIIVNIPASISIINSGFLWPLEAWKELVSGQLLAANDEITVSPR